MDIDVDWSEAPHDAQEYGESNGFFYKEEGGIWFYWKAELNKSWQECSMGQPLAEDRIPRPKAPEAEWVDGLPPVGCECEYRPDPKIHDGWQLCVYLAHYDREHFVLVSESGEVDRMLDTLSPSFRFRPIRTKEQMQREELEHMLCPALRQLRHNNSDGFVAAYDRSEVLEILSRYNLEPKQ